MKNKIYLYNLNNELIEIFDSYKECAEYFNKTEEYIKYNLEYYTKIKKQNEWYKISLIETKSKSDKEKLKELEKMNYNLKNELRIKEERIKKLEKELQGVQLLVYESIKRCQQ